MARELTRAGRLVVRLVGGLPHVGAGLEQVEVAEFDDLDLVGLVTHQVCVVPDDPVLVLDEQRGEPPHLVADLDRTILVRSHRLALLEGAGEAGPERLLTDDPGDLVVRGDRLVELVDVDETCGTVERAVRLDDEQRLPVLSQHEHVERPDAVLQVVSLERLDVDLELTCENSLVLLIAQSNLIRPLTTLELQREHENLHSHPRTQCLKW